MPISSDIKTRHQRCRSAVGSALPSNANGDGSTFCVTCFSCLFVCRTALIFSNWKAKIMSTPQSSRFTFTRRQSASNKTPRQINRNLVFNLVRTRQPLSRADLARVSGLQRSTVSLIVEDLIKEKWILEGSTGRPPRGRRPTFLERNHQRAVIALDIHPSPTTAALNDVRR